MYEDQINFTYCEPWRVGRMLEVLRRVEYDTKDILNETFYGRILSVSEHGGVLNVTLKNKTNDEILEVCFRMAWVSVNETEESVNFTYEEE